MTLIMRHTMIATTTAKVQYQYSDRRARPLKSAYLFSTVRIASVNDILVLLVGPQCRAKSASEVCGKSMEEDGVLDLSFAGRSHLDAALIQRQRETPRRLPQSAHLVGMSK